MPKLGRRGDGNQIQYLYPNASVTKHAPFGTADTPQQRLRIVGGRPVFSKEDGHFGTPRWAQSPEPLRSPNRRSSRGTSPGTPLKLAPLTEKPTNFNPAELTIQAGNFYRSGVQDSSNSHVHNLHDHQSDRQINQHSVVPPIGVPNVTSQPQYVAPPAPSVPVYPPPPQIDLIRHLPRDGSYLSKHPIQLTKDEELELRRLVRDDLDDYKVHKLKDLYLELTGFDPKLTGFITYTDLGFALLRGKMALSAVNLRLVASLSVDESAPGLVNYEKILSFISATLRNEKPPSITEPIPQATVETKIDPPSPRSKRFPYGAGDNAKLLRLIEAAILESGQELNFDKIRNTFGRADRGRRGMLSREQIKTLAYESNIPLQDSILNNIIDKLDTSNGQYNWTQFIEFMEKVQPMTTGLNIPESKRPTEYVKHYPMPTTDWPQNKDSLVPQTPNITSHEQQGFVEPAHKSAPYQQHPSGPPPTHRHTGGFEQLEHQHRQQASLNSVQREFRKLDSDYQQATKKVDNTESKGLEPWFDRYMKLADALYMSDLDKSGHLTARETQWLVSKYNDIYQLGIPDTKIQEAIRNTAVNENRIPIDPLLKYIARR